MSMLASQCIVRATAIGFGDHSAIQLHESVENVLTDAVRLQV